VFVIKAALRVRGLRDSSPSGEEFRPDGHGTRGIRETAQAIAVPHDTGSPVAKDGIRALGSGDVVRVRAMADELTPLSSADDEAGLETASVVLAMLDKALSLQAPLADRHIARLRRSRPDAQPVKITKRLNAEFRAATISAGAGVGAAAAAPGVGTAAALALSGTEALGFLNATSLYVLSRATVHGIPVYAIERRRTLVMAVMLGEAGAKSVQKVAERTGQHWAKSLVKGIPQAKINAVNKVLGRHFVTKYGTKQGIVVLGRVIPFGIGAAIGGAANAAFSQGIIKAADGAFGPAPESWDLARPAEPTSSAPFR
jgi:hypothetical protein